MPKYVIPIPRVFETVTRPLIKKVTEEVCVQFNIPKKTEFVFYGQAAGIPIRNSTIDSERDNGLRLNTEGRITVQYEEEVTNPFEVTVLRPNQRFIFLDESLHIWLKPVFVPMKMTLNFEYIAKDKNSAQQWRQQAQMNSYRMASQFNIDADFHYNIPNPVAMQLVRLYALREHSQEPLNESLAKWFRRCYSPNMTVLSDVAGKRTAHAIAVKLLGVHVVVDMQHDIAPVEKDNDAGNWKTSFSVTLWYDRPDDIVMVYPLMVHNQLIPKKYREDNPVSLHDRSYFDGNRSLHLSDLQAFETRRNTRHIDRFTSGIKLPRFDDWIHTHQLRYHACMNTILIGLMPDDPRWVFTFDDAMLGDYAFKDVAIPYMKTSGQSMVIPYDSVFHISVHEWSDVLHGDTLIVDKDLKLSSTKDLDYKKMYHVVMTLLCDLSHLSDKGWDDLLEHPEFWDEYVDAVYPGAGLDNLPKKPDGSIDKEAAEDALKDAVDKGKAETHTKNPHPKTTNNYTIVTRRQEIDHATRSRK